MSIRSASGQYSVFRVVITHVARVLIWTWIGASLLGIPMMLLTEGLGLPEWITVAGAALIVAVACFLGTQHSLVLLHQRAHLVANPAACVVGSIATFAGTVGGLMILVALPNPRRDIIGAMVLGGYWLAATLVFSIMTRRRLNQIALHRTRGFEVQPMRTVSESRLK